MRRRAQHPGPRQRGQPGRHPAEPTTLKVYTWWDITKFEHLQKMKEDFEAQNPDVKLEFVTVPSKYADTMVTGRLPAARSPM